MEFHCIFIILDLPVLLCDCCACGSGCYMQEINFISPPPRLKVWINPCQVIVLGTCSNIKVKRRESLQVVKMEHREY